MKKLILFIAFIVIVFVSKGQKLEQLKGVLFTTTEANRAAVGLRSNAQTQIDAKIGKDSADIKYVQKDSVTNFSTAEFQHMIDSTLNSVIHGSFQYGDSTYTAIYTARKTPTGLATGIILDYEFQESTVTSAADASGNGYTGTLTGITNVNYTGFDTNASNLDKAYAFGGPGYYIDAGDNDAFSFTSGTVDAPFSLEAKVKFLSIPGGHNTLIGKTGEYYLERSSSGQARLMIYDHTGTGTYIGKLGTTVLASGGVYEITATYDGSGTADGMHIYVNGIDDGGTASVAGTYTYKGNSTDHLYVGRYSDGVSYNILAYIANARLWSLELTPTKVSNLYNGGNYFPYTSWE